jgi:hypothetical protein
MHTDGSQWAKLHLYDLFRGPDSHCFLAASVTAALPSQAETLPILFISDGSLWQTFILKKLNIPFIILPQRGTVTAAALDLAFSLTRGNVLIAGMDLANRDMRTHCRPYSFDRLIEEKAGRANPAYSQSFKRSSQLKEGGSYRVYASWFKKQLSSYPKRLYSLGKNNPLFNGIESLKQMPCREFPREARGFYDIGISYSSVPEAGIRQRAFLILKNALEDTLVCSRLEEELKSLLCPGCAAVTQKELLEALRSAINPGNKSG